MYVFHQFAEFSGAISSYTFCTLLFLLSFWDSDDMNVKPLDFVPLALFVYFSIIFSLFFRLDTFYCSVFELTDSVLCYLCSTFEPLSFGYFIFLVLRFYFVV